MREQEMWDDGDRTIKSLIGEIPDWLDADLWENKSEAFVGAGCGWLRGHGPLTPADVAAILKGGCESGSFMPAVTYWSAKAAMHRWGDEIFAYISERLDDVPAPETCESWSGLACFYVSTAVELWAADTLAALEAIE